MARLSILRAGDPAWGSPDERLVVFVNGQEMGLIRFDQELEFDMPQGRYWVEVGWRKWGPIRKLIYGDPMPEALRSPPFEVQLLPGETAYLACGIRQVREFEPGPLWVLLNTSLSGTRPKVLGLLEVWPRTAPGESPLERFLNEPTGTEDREGDDKPSL